MAEKKNKSPEAAEPETASQQEAAGTEQESPSQSAQAEQEAKAPDETEALKEQVKDLNDKLLRSMAEFDNFRKRSQREKDQIYNDAKADTAAQFLTVLDNFERALATESTDENFRKGVQMIYDGLLETIKKLGIEEINPTEGDFDPTLHHAVMHVDDDSLGQSQVVEVFQKGYRMGDKILRYAMVKVAN